MSNRPLVLTLLLAPLLATVLAPTRAMSAPTLDAGDQKVLDACIEDWGAASPFKKGAPVSKVVSPGTKVFGIGKNNNGDETATAKPALVLVRPAVNVMGKTTIRLANPKGWYCFRSNVTVAGKIAIEAHCDAHIASARDGGTSVMAKDESDKGVAVMGALRITRFGCVDKKENPEKAEKPK